MPSESVRKCGLSALSSLLLLSSVALANPAPKPNPFFGILGELAWLDVKPTECTATATLDSLCSRSSLSQLIAWANAQDCSEEQANAFVEEMAQALSERARNRAQAHFKWSARTAEERKVIASEIATQDGQTAAEVERQLNEFLTSLEKNVTANRALDSRERVLNYTYFHTGHRLINQALRSSNEAHVRCIQPLKNELLRSFNQLQEVQGVVWRGTSLPESLLEQYQPGAEFTWASFSSTSAERGVAEGFVGNSKGSVLFKLHSKKCLDVSGVSDKLWEHEVLCLPATRVRVKNIEAPNLIELEEI
jgi:hypothetical protein